MEDNKGKKEENFFQKLTSKLVPVNKIDGYDAYLLAKYGKVETPEDRLKRFYEDTDSLIKGKASMGEWCCSVEIPIELISNYKDDIINNYQSKKFFVLVITNETIHTNEKNNKEDIKGTYLFFCWDSLIK
jgi:hypothetical protein